MTFLGDEESFNNFRRDASQTFSVDLRPQEFAFKKVSVILVFTSSINNLKLHKLAIYITSEAGIIELDLLKESRRNT